MKLLHVRMGLSGGLEKRLCGWTAKARFPWHLFCTCFGFSLSLYAY